jgi:5-enolpyruvylshikimate-3-phosphate synthase
MPDMALTIAALAAIADSATTMLSTNILRYKESDRLNAIMVELTKLDAAVSISDDGDTLIIVRPDNFNQRPSIPTMTTEWQWPSAC